MTDTAPATVPADPWSPFLREVSEGLVRAVGSVGARADPGELSAALTFESGPKGDAAFAVHRLAQSVGRPPHELAAAVAGGFVPQLEVREVAAHGAYVNFGADPTRLVELTLGSVLRRGPRYGHAEEHATPACVEHTSANPTGPFHIGRVRNAIIGDTLARILRASGVPVSTQYYVDDLGRQSAMITWIWTKPRSSWPPEIAATVDGHEVPGEKADQRLGRPYPAVSAYLKTHPDAAAEVAALVQTLEQGDAPPEHRRLAEEVLGGMLTSLERIHIGFDEFVWESDFVRDGSVERVLERCRASPHAVRAENGAWSLDVSAHHLPKESQEIVVQRGNGTSLYIARDIAYHLAKLAKFDRVVDVLGQDHRLHARSLEAVLAEIGETRRPEFVIYQDITVPEGGRMSTRGGSAVWLDQLLSEAVERARAEVLARRDDLPAGEVDVIAESVATSAVRYHVLRVAPEKPVVFRWEDALSFEGRSAPFLQYSYVRAESVLRKADALVAPYPFDPLRLGQPEEVELVKSLAALPRTVAYAARSAHVHALAGYAHDLAERFNRFYHEVPVLRSGEERASRIALVAAVRQALGNTLDLLGLGRLEAM